MRRWLIGVCVFGFFGSIAASVFAEERLEQRLKSISVENLVSDVKSKGDPQRGALIFYQANLNCAKCHESQEVGKSLGPDLTKVRSVELSHLVKSILDPSETIHEGYETAIVQTDEGKTISGVLVKETDDEIVLARIENPEKTQSFLIDEIEWKQSKKSTMPEGLANQLADEQQFFDLISYLATIAKDGPARAAQLRPATAFIQLPPLPEYENRIDHRGLISQLNRDSIKSGAKLFELNCASCHGTLEMEGSMPTSLRFTEGQFKNGGDPLTMYQTLTHGYGMMNPQRWMVPQQKYEVIHYIREELVKKHNPTEYVKVDSAYLSSLPEGDTKGPKPASSEPWVQMDYGPSLMNTIEISRDGSNIAQKGIAVRLDQGPGGVAQGNHWMLYEHDTMRVAGAWSGQFVDWNGIHFNGRHGIHPRVPGQIHFANATGPGFGRPGDQSFEDNRVVGRDGKRYGPFDRDWIHYRGMYRYGDRSIINYTVGKAEVLEMPELAYLDQEPVFTRQFNIGPRDQDLVIQLAETKNLELVKTHPWGVELQRPGFQASSNKESKKGRQGNWQLDGSTYAQLEDGSQFDMTSKDFTIAARIRTKKNGTIFCKTKNWAEWIPDGKVFFVRGGRLTFDIGWVGAVQSKDRVNDGKWHDVAMTWSKESGQVRFYIDGKESGGGELRPENPVDDHAIRVGYTNEDFPNPSFFQGSIDAVRFYQRKLTKDELQPKVEVNEDGLRVHWKGVNGSQLTDVSPHSRHAEVIAGDQTESLPETIGLMVSVGESGKDFTWINEDGNLRLKVNKGNQPIQFSVFYSPLKQSTDRQELISSMPFDFATMNLETFVNGGPANYPEIIETVIERGQEDGPFAVDVLNEPRDNRWNCRVRLTGLDFCDDGDTAICTAWDGSVWRVTGIKSLEGKLKWKRIASGLFQPLGVKIRDGEIFVTCRDQLVRLHDLNGDGEMDWYENFNSDHQVTEHFHEFAMGLQTDDDGNFYYAKSARHALTALVPHHGTLLKVSADGSKTDILANGFRAANGVCLNPDGTFYVTDQEGHWNPKNRINWVKEGGFYGNMFGYHDVTDDSDEAMDPPMCWITNSFDRSPSELMWVDSEKWGPLNGSLLNFSYGYGQVYVCPHETINGQVQGGMCAFPIARFPTGVMRGRFHPDDGQLYCCGMFAWAGSQHRPGGLYRIRYTGNPVHLPVELNATEKGMKVKFTEEVDRESATNPNNYKIKTWTIKRTARYGSNHFDEKELAVSKVELDDDCKTVTLHIPDIHKTRCMEIVFSIQSTDDKKVEGRIHNTIHNFGKDE